MGFDFEVSVPALAVFLQGLISFFSPCVFPLIPLYIGYLSGGTARRREDGEMEYDQKKVIWHTLFFVLGVSFAFFALGFGFSVMGQFFKSNQLLFARIGGVFVFLFGLYQLGAFGSSGVLSREHRLPFQLDRLTMSPATAFIMGFTFSFAWTPCVGPVLTSVLLMTASAGSEAAGFLLIGVYTLGFVIPFLAVGLFTTKLLSIFKKYRGVVKYTVKAGGVLMMVMGILMFTGRMNALTGYLSQLTTEQPSNTSSGITDAGEEEDEGKTAESETELKATEAEPEESETEQKVTEEEEAESERKQKSAEATVFPAIDFTLTDQYGNSHTLSDYKGKTVFLNFWATWCPPCRAEMPDIQKLYETYDTEGEDALIVLGIAAPGYGREGSEEEVTAFLEENGYTYPVLMDRTGEQFIRYGIMSYPTTFMIDRNGNIFGYVRGQLNEEIMRSIIEQTMEGKRS